jgi:hypothetical protein
MGSNKPLIVLRLLKDHGFDTVIISDVDTVWMRDPSEFLLRHPTADVLISTDCLSHWIEAHYDPAQKQHQYFHRCGHLPGATFGRAFNTGVIIFRKRYAASMPGQRVLASTDIVGGCYRVVAIMICLCNVLKGDVARTTSRSQQQKELHAGRQHSPF